LSTRLGRRLKRRVFFKWMINLFFSNLVIPRKEREMLKREEIYG